MKTNIDKKEENRNIKFYQKKMKSIEFMHPYGEDIDVFNPNSSKFKTFLIQSFAHLHSHFHYLSFLGNEDIDKELVKVSEIFQILPQNLIPKGGKLFENVSEGDIHKYWIKFFSLFNIKNNELCFESIFDLNWENNISFLKNINDTVHYLGYDFPVVKSKKIEIVDLNKEIETWNEKADSCDKPLDESSVTNLDSEEISHVNIQNLINDLKQIVTMFNDLKHTDYDYKPIYYDFFSNFISLVKDISKYNNELHVIVSSNLDVTFDKIVSEEEFDWSANFYFLKRCNNLIQTLKSKVKELN